MHFRHWHTVHTIYQIKFIRMTDLGRLSVFQLLLVPKVKIC